jgi:hypothetical protein
MDHKTTKGTPEASSAGDCPLSETKECSTTEPSGLCLLMKLKGGNAHSLMGKQNYLNDNFKAAPDATLLVQY